MQVMIVFKLRNESAAVLFGDSDFRRCVLPANHLEFLRWQTEWCNLMNQIIVSMVTKPYMKRILITWLFSNNKPSGIEIRVGISAIDRGVIKRAIEYCEFFLVLHSNVGRCYQKCSVQNHSMWDRTHNKQEIWTWLKEHESKKKTRQQSE